MPDLQDSLETPGHNLRLWVATLTPITVTLIGLTSQLITADNAARS